MQERAKKLWARFEANQPASTLAILLTLTVGILIGTVVSGHVKGQEKRSSDATPLSVPSPRQLSNQFSQIAKTLEPAVVNINTESTIKPSVRRRGGQNPGGGGQGNPNDDQENPFGDFFDQVLRQSGQCRPHSRALTRLRCPCGPQRIHRHQSSRNREG